MSREPEEQQQAYYIPWNYDDAGGVLGGKITTRNAIELAVICGPLAFLEYHLLRFSWQVNLTIAMITLIPLAAFCLIGFGRESISQRVFALYRFHKRQRKLSYMYFTEYKGVGNRKFSIDNFLDDVATVGLKKAIGARKKVILGQFLTEASVLTSIGGIIGVILGIILSKVVAQVSGAPTAISVPAIIGSVVFSMLIGLIFGLLPSVKAANLNPIDALRSE